ncbi:MAG: hypothetical protein ACLR43_00555 [Faecalibacillus faecis]
MNKRINESSILCFPDSRLLKMSILENIRMSRPEASDEEVIQALKMPNVKILINSLMEFIPL